MPSPDTGDWATRCAREIAYEMAFAVSDNSQAKIATILRAHADKRIADLEVALRELLTYGVELDDPRLTYVVAHLDKDAVAAARSALEEK